MLDPIRMLKEMPTGHAHSRQGGSLVGAPDVRGARPGAPKGRSVTPLALADTALG